MRAPKLRYALCLNLLEKIAIPTVILLNMVPHPCKTMLFIQFALSLQIRGQIVVVCEIKAFLQILAYLAYNFVDFFHIVDFLSNF